MTTVSSRFQDISPLRPARLVITDPPYNIGHDYGPVSDNLSPAEYRQLVEDLSAWARDNTEHRADMFVIHYPEFFLDHAKHFRYGGWDFHQWITWCYPSNIGHSKSRFTRSSRAVVWFTKNGGGPFNPKADPEPYRNPTDKRVRGLLENGSAGRAPYDWWEIDLQKNVAHGHDGYSNQIPRPLLRRIILSASEKNDLVVDPFCGTGSTVLTATELDRVGWGCDANPELVDIWYGPNRSDSVQEWL